MKKNNIKDGLVKLDEENQLTDEEMEKIIGGDYGPGKKEIGPGTYNPKIVPPPDPHDSPFMPTSPV